MYIKDFYCTYKLHDDESCEEIYRLQFLQAFNLTKWNDKIIEKETQLLFKSFQEMKMLDLKDVIDKIKKEKKYAGLITILGSDDYDIFKILFMYELFDYAHKCFCDFLNKGAISEENKKLLMNNI